MSDESQAAVSQLMKEAGDLLARHNSLIEQFNQLQAGLTAILFCQPEQKVELDLDIIRELDTVQWTINVHKPAESNVITYRLVPRKTVVNEPEETKKLEVCPHCRDIKEVGAPCLVCQDRSARLFQMPSKVN